MEYFFDILKELLPLWLFLIVICFIYLIFLYTRIFRKTNDLAEKQAQYFKERLDSLEKTTAIYDRALERYKEEYEHECKKTKKMNKLQCSHIPFAIERLIAEIKTSNLDTTTANELIKLLEEVTKTITTQTKTKQKISGFWFAIDSTVQKALPSSTYLTTVLEYLEIKLN